MIKISKLNKPFPPHIAFGYSIFRHSRDKTNIEARYIIATNKGLLSKQFLDTF